jgi:hypothetical protein
VMMTAALDDDGFRACDRRRRDRERAKGCNDKSNLSHDVLLQLVKIKPAIRGNVPEELEENSEQVFRHSS